MEYLQIDIDILKYIFKLRDTLGKREAKNEEEVLLKICFDKFEPRKDLNKQINFFNNILNKNTIVENNGQINPTLNFVLKCFLLILFRNLKSQNLKYTKYTEESVEINTLFEKSLEEILDQFLEKINYYENNFSCKQIQRKILKLNLPSSLENNLYKLFIRDCYLSFDKRILAIEKEK